ncbi:trypsin-like serine protease [bacterium]|nr:trypsin-like serine protease [bacterium]
MIHEYINHVKKATFCVMLPDLHSKFNSPSGTGFFISADGWFVTAAHVITEDGSPFGKIRSDVTSAWLEKESHFDEADQFITGTGCMSNEGVEYINPHLDFALIKVDFNKNRHQEGFNHLQGFPYLTVSRRVLAEGEDVFSFGYPLSTFNEITSNCGEISLSPRTTSAIVSSLIDRTKTMRSTKDPKIYVLDKALNYGNSGGPILASATGAVHAFCSRFQPVYVPQAHLTIPGSPTPMIMTPSLYGVVVRLANEVILKELERIGVKTIDS